MLKRLYRFINSTQIARDSPKNHLASSVSTYIVRTTEQLPSDMTRRLQLSCPKQRFGN
jgi:hypothetical protein